MGWKNTLTRHGAEPFLRRHYLRSYSRIFQHFMEPKVYYRVHKSPPQIPILSQTNPLHTTLSYFSKINFNINHPSTSRSSLRSFLLVCPPKSHMHSSSPYAYYILCLSQPPWLDQYNYICRIVQVMNLLIMQFSPSSCHLFPLWSEYSPQHPVWNIYIPLYSPLNVREQVSYQYKSTGKIMPF
jgi:hypothetical protein